jgi:hypothetical protein
MLAEIDAFFFPASGYAFFAASGYAIGMCSRRVS